MRRLYEARCGASSRSGPPYQAGSAGAWAGSGGATLGLVDASLALPNAPFREAAMPS